MINKLTIYNSSNPDTQGIVEIAELFPSGLNLVRVNRDSKQIERIDTYTGSFDVDDLLESSAPNIPEEDRIILLATREFVLLPEPIFQAYNQRVEGNAASSGISFNPGLDFENINGIQIGINQSLDEGLIDLNGYSTTRLHLLKELLRKHQPHLAEEGLVIFYPGYVWVLVWRQEKPLYLNAITYSSAADIVYYLLSIAKEFDIPAESMHWFYSGMLETDSNMMEILNRHLHHFSPLNAHPHYQGVLFNENKIAHIARIVF